MRASIGRRAVLALSALAIAAIPSAGNPGAAEQTAGDALRVCADPNNLPFSSERRDGFENRLAELFGEQLGQPITYTWWAQRRGFVRNTLKAGNCDVIMGVPVGLEMVETTHPYYRSSYVFIARADRHLDIGSITDPRLRKLKIGVQLIGDDGFNTPPAHALAEEGIVDNVVGYTVYGDYRQPNPPARIVEAVERGDIDIAAVWGPQAGYFARRSPVALTILPISGTARFAPLLFQFDIAIGVRKGDDRRREEFDELISDNPSQIARILSEYGVPVIGGSEQRAEADRLEPAK